MIAEHLCDKALIVEQHSQGIVSLGDAHSILDRRVTEMETEMHGHTRNGGGFVGDTRDTLTGIQSALSSLNNRMHGVEESVKALVVRQGSVRELMKTVLPPIIVGAVTILTVLMTRGIPR